MMTTDLTSTVFPTGKSQADAMLLDILGRASRG